MADQDILAILRDRHANVTGVDPRIATPIVGPTIFSQSADGIECLRKGLDELRRLYCNTMSSGTQTYVEGNRKTPNQIADEMEWNCFKENTDGQ